MSRADRPQIEMRRRRAMSREKSVSEERERGREEQKGVKDDVLAGVPSCDIEQQQGFGH
jgi:hypothetical protein